MVHGIWFYRNLLNRTVKLTHHRFSAHFSSRKFQDGHVINLNATVMCTYTWYRSAYIYSQSWLLLSAYIMVSDNMADRGHCLSVKVWMFAPQKLHPSSAVARGIFKPRQSRGVRGHAPQILFFLVGSASFNRGICLGVPQCGYGTGIVLITWFPMPLHLAFI